MNARSEEPIAPVLKQMLDLLEYVGKKAVEDSHPSVGNWIVVVSTILDLLLVEQNQNVRDIDDMTNNINALNQWVKNQSGDGK